MTRYMIPKVIIIIVAICIVYVADVYAVIVQSDSLAQFKRQLKTHLFGLWDHSAL